MKKILILIILIILFKSIFAIDLVYYFDIRDSLTIGLTGAPYGSYSSETGIGFGVNLLIFEKPIENNITPFEMKLDCYYSASDEEELSVKTCIPIRKYKQFINIETKYKSKPQSFFGIGANTDTDEEIEFQKTYFVFSGDWNRILSKSISLGTAFDLSGYKNELEEINITDYQISGYTDFYRVFGLGSKLIINTKDANSFPSSGYYYRNQFMVYDKRIISDFNFITLSQEFHYFYSFGNHIIANQLVSENTFKDRPFHYLTEQGGSSIMRGYQTARFLDNHFIGYQTEYRAPLILWRVSPVAFVSLGNSYKGINDFKKENLHLAGGFGFRFALDVKTRLNLRADIGFSKDGKQIYLKFGEAF